MMLTQFRIRYPQGSVISELVTIDHGKYIVRVSINVGTITLGTGLGGADTIEAAEDAARNRALGLLNLDTISVNSPNNNGSPVSETPNQKTTPTTVGTPEPSLSSEVPNNSMIAQTATETSLPPQNVGVSTSVEVPQTPTTAPNFSKPSALAQKPISEFSQPSFSSSSITDTQSGDKPSVDQREPINTVKQMGQELEAGTEPMKDVSPKPSPIEPETQETGTELTEDISRTSSFSTPETTLAMPEMENVATSTPTTSPEVPEMPVSAAEPLEFSEIIARSDVEMKRLGWTKVQGREYLIQTYGKRSRQVLSDEELLEFLYYLESLPTP